MLNMSTSPSSSSYRVHSEPLLDSRGRQVTDTNSRGERCNVSLKRHNSMWDMAGEQAAARNQAAANHPTRTPAGIQLAANKIYGDAYEAHVGRALNRDPRFTEVQDQVRLVPKPSGAPYSTQELKDLSKQAGATLRSDFVAKENGSYKNIECKSSNTAGYTQNQSNMLSDIRHNGAIVVSDRGSYDRKDNLGKVSTTTVRPSNEDGVFEQETLKPAAPPAPRPARPPEDPVYGRRW